MHSQQCRFTHRNRTHPACPFMEILIPEGSSYKRTQIQMSGKLCVMNLKTLRLHPFELVKEHITYVSGTSRTYRMVYAPIRYPQQSFAKLLPLLPPNPLKPRWTGRFKGWWHHLFLYRKKGCCHHFHLFSTPEDRWRGEKTGGGGGPNDGKRRRVRTDRTTVAYRQKHGCNQSKPQ